MNIKKAIVVLATVVLLTLFLRWCAHFLEVDRCLDAGGRWIEQEDRCDGAQY